MPKVRCHRCKNFYKCNGLPAKCCPECALKDEQDYQIVRRYVKDNPGSLIHNVETNTGISKEKILNYLREERLEIVGNTISFLKCSKCSKTIYTGTICEECRRKYGDTKSKMGSHSEKKS